MPTVLKRIQPAVIKYAQIIEQVTRVDVEIVDTRLDRIAGTGIKNTNISKSMANEGRIYNYVLQTGETCYIDNPKENELCRYCSQKEECHELTELAMPITLGEERIGVIGLICFNPAAQARVAANVTAYREFTKTIADFISTKAYEYQESLRTKQTMDVLNEVISHVAEGVLLLRQDGRVQGANTSAVNQLPGMELLGHTVTIKETGDTILDQKEYAISANDQTIVCYGEMITIDSPLAGYDHIFLFNNLKNVKSSIYQLTNLDQEQGASQIIGQADNMRQLKKQIRKVADSSSTVLITGESGVGKGLIARVIHSEGARKDKPFVSVNCGAIPDTLLESELFGYVKGAFTGADPRGKIGKFEMADKGTIFLDEIGDLPLYLQVKLLSVLQDRKLSRIGSNQIIDIDVRVIAATNKDLVTLIRKNKFRRDLYYRLNVIPLLIPPLRERKEDIPALIQMLLKKYSRLFSRSTMTLEPNTLQLLKEYSWPGNVRELENTIEFMVNMADSGVLTMQCLPENIRRYHDAGLPTGHPAEEETAQAGKEGIVKLKDLEKEAILHALSVCGETMEGKQEAAKRLGIGIATLYRKLDKYK